MPDFVMPESAGQILYLGASVTAVFAEKIEQPHFAL
jgi:hypothetical protein